MHQTIMSAHGTDPNLDHSELERIAMAARKFGTDGRFSPHNTSVDFNRGFASGRRPTRLAEKQNGSGPIQAVCRIWKRRRLAALGGAAVSLQKSIECVRVQQIQ